MLHNIIVSTWRTLAPYVVSFLVVQAARLGVELDDASVMSALTIAGGTVYHALVRWLEERVSPRWGWLIGLAEKPEYRASDNLLVLPKGAIPSQGSGEAD